MIKNIAGKDTLQTVWFSNRGIKIRLVAQSLSLPEAQSLKSVQ